MQTLTRMDMIVIEKYYHIIMMDETNTYFVPKKFLDPRAPFVHLPSLQNI